MTFPQHKMFTHYTFNPYTLWSILPLVFKSHKIQIQWRIIFLRSQMNDRVGFEVLSCEFLSRTNSIAQNLVLVNSDHLIILDDVSPKYDCNIVHHWILPLSSFYFFTLSFLSFYTFCEFPQELLSLPQYWSLSMLYCHALYNKNLCWIFTKLDRILFFKGQHWVLVKNPGSVAIFPGFRAYLTLSHLLYY